MGNLPIVRVPLAYYIVILIFPNEIKIKTNYYYGFYLDRKSTCCQVLGLGAGVAQFEMLYVLFGKRRIRFLWHSPRKGTVHCTTNVL